MATLHDNGLDPSMTGAGQDHRLVIDTIPGLVWSALPDGYIDFLNQRWREYTGLTLAQASGWGWQIAIHPDDLPELVNYWRSVLTSGQPGETEARLRRYDGAYRWFLFRAVPLYDEQGILVKWYGQNTDIDDRQWSEALLAGEKRVLEMSARGYSLFSILDALCRLVEEISSQVRATILLLSPVGDRLWVGAAPSLPASFAHQSHGFVIGPATGPCGMAVYRREPVIIADIATAPLPDDHRDFPLAHGLRACWSTPILAADGQVLGTFALYARESGHPDARHQEIIERITHLAAIAIERDHTEAALRQSEAYLAQAQQLSRTGSFGWNLASGRIIWSNETFCILGYNRQIEPTLERLFDRVHPEDLAHVRWTIDQAMRDRTGFDLQHRLSMPDGSVKQVHIVARATPLEFGAVEFVGAVMDVTEQVRSQEATRAAKARFEGILEIAEDAIISVDAKQRIVLFNRGAERVFGYIQAEVIGKSLDLLLPQRFVDAHHRHLNDFAQSASRIARGMGQRREVFGLRKNGQEFPAEASISKLDLGDERILTVILRDITQRKQAAEALRASEHLARGQLDALTHTLDALAQESDPDRLLEHVLRTLVEQSSAHSVTVWNRSDIGDWLDLIAVVEDGCFQTRGDAAHPAAQLPIESQDHPIWREIFRTGQYAVLEDIDRTTAQLRIGSNPDAVWHTVMDDTHADPDSCILLLKKHLQTLGIRAVLFIPMLIAGQVTGITSIRFQTKRSFRREEIELAQALAHQATLAIQLTRLSRQSRQVAITAERNRMARDIHDTLAQGFTGVIVQLEAAADATTKGLAAEAEAHCGRASDIARDGLKEARRSVQALRLQALEEKNLCEALNDLLRKTTQGTPLQASCILQGAPRALPAEWEDNILRIGQEVLINTLRHAQAQHFSLQLTFAADGLLLELRDDGRGFDPLCKHDGFGLLGIGERVKSMGGRLTIQSGRNTGTVIIITLPLPHDPSVSLP